MALAVGIKPATIMLYFVIKIYVVIQAFCGRIAGRIAKEQSKILIIIRKRVKGYGTRSCT